MKHRYRLQSALLSALVLAGCGMEDSGSSAFNPATDVDLTFSTFDLENTPDAPDNLEHTRFHDFYRGIEPLGDDPDQLATVAEIREHIAIFTGAIPAEDGTDYRMLRNPLDLMNQVIASGEVANFREGRNYIARRIADGKAGTYSNRANQAQIRFVDQAAVLAAGPLNDQIWIYPTLDWRYVPQADGNTGKVYRTIQYVARSVADEDTDSQPELLSVLAGSRFHASNFPTQGYGSPEYATADYLSRSFGSIELRQDYIDEKTDTLFIHSPERQVIDLGRYGVTDPADGSPDCLRLELDYALAELRIFSSDGVAATIAAPTENDPDNTENNPDYCGFQQAADARVWWPTVSVPGRQ